MGPLSGAEMSVRRRTWPSAVTLVQPCLATSVANAGGGVAGAALSAGAAGSACPVGGSAGTAPGSPEAAAGAASAEEEDEAETSPAGRASEVESSTMSSEATDGDEERDGLRAEVSSIRARTRRGGCPGARAMCGRSREAEFDNPSCEPVAEMETSGTRRVHDACWQAEMHQKHCADVDWPRFPAISRPPSLRTRMGQHSGFWGNLTMAFCLLHILRGPLILCRLYPWTDLSSPGRPTPASPPAAHLPFPLPPSPSPLPSSLVHPSRDERAACGVCSGGRHARPT